MGETSPIGRSANPNRSRSRTARLPRTAARVMPITTARSWGTRSANFELKVDVKVKANATGGSNGGVYILTEFEERGGNVRASGDFPSKGFEIQINNAYARDQVKTGSLYHVADITESPVKDDEWFTFHIVVKDQTITVKVNEQQTVSWTQPADWNGGRELPGRTITPGGGTIALQAHDANSVVY